MAAPIRIPDKDVLEALNLEGYNFNDYLKYMKDEYPNIDPIAFYTSKGEDLVTGFYSETGNFIPDDWDIPLDSSAEIEPFDNQSGMLEYIKREKIKEEEKDFSPREKARAKLLRKKEEEEQKTEEPVTLSWYDKLSDEEKKIVHEDIPLQTDFFGGLEGVVFGTDFEEGLLAKSGINPTIAAIGATIGTRNPKYLLRKKGMLEPVTPRVSTTKSTILKPKKDSDALIDRTKSNVSTKKATTVKPVEAAVSTKNSTILKPVESTISAKNTRVLKETEPRISTKNSTILKPVESVTRASVLNKAAKGQTLTRKEKLLLATITGAAGTAAVTSRMGNRDIDGSLIPIVVDEPEVVPEVVPEAESEFIYKPHMTPEQKEKDDRKIDFPKVNARPGWYQGSSKTDTDDGNYWSADFEDEYWNTPAGVQEAINIWGRPIGNRIGNPIKWNW